VSIHNKRDYTHLTPALPDITDTNRLELVARFARYVAKQGTKAFLIGENNRNLGWIPFDEALESGQAFAVKVDDDVLALDADDPEQSELLEHEFLPYLCECNLHPVLVASGRPSHRHLFVRVMNPDARRQITEKARELGIDCRKVIRPPLAPHRLGYEVGLIYPSSLEDALDSLQSSNSQKSRPQPSNRIFDLLRYGDRARDYKSRSEVLMAITMAWVNAGWSESSLIKALRRPINLGGAKVQEIEATQSREAAERYVARDYRKAQSRVDQQPAIRRDSDTNSFLDQLRQAISFMSWRGLSGANDRYVLEAHFAIAQDCGHITYGASVREIEARAGLDSTSTVSRSHQRLIKRGVLRLEKAPKGGMPYVWKLLIPEESSGTFLSHNGGVRQNVPAVSLNHDVWRHHGLGHSSSLVWLELDAHRGMGKREIAAIRHLTTQTIRHHLAKLQMHGLVGCDQFGLWRRVERNLDEVASELGTYGASGHQRHRHHLEREVFSDALRHPKNRME
jgi:hypothetical protein